MSRLTGGEAVIESLVAGGVDTVFGIPGVHTLAIYDALLDRQDHIRHFMTRHEQGAGFAADGYARVTGKPGVALPITGPGLANISTSVGQAYSDSSPLLIISSQNATGTIGRGTGDLHEMRDQQAFMAATTAWSRRVTRVEEIPATIFAAFTYLATQRPRPVHIEIPLDILQNQADVKIPSYSTPSREAPERARLDDAITMLRQAQRPVFIAGGGAMKAGKVLTALAEVCGAAVLTTCNGKGVIADRQALSFGCRFGDEAADALLAEADLILAVGTELAPVDIRNVSSLEGKLIHLDLDGSNMGRRVRPEVPLIGDARRGVREILQQMQGRAVVMTDAWQDRIQGLKSAMLDRDAESREESAGSRQQHEILTALRRSMADNAVLVNDMTMLSYTAIKRWPSLVSGTFLFPRGYGTLGFSLPVAIGARLGQPHRQVVSVIGDGGFQFTGMEFATAVQYRLPLPVVVLNNSSWGVVKIAQDREYGRNGEVDLVNPDFVAWAQAYGRPAYRIFDIEKELPQRIREAFTGDGPTLLEIPVSF